MTLRGIRGVALLSALAAGLALALALGSEQWGGLVPCALCLWERWPYRVAIACGLLAIVVPYRFSKLLLWLVVSSMLGSVALAALHVGVEQRYWASPLPECVAPRLSSGSVAARLAQMPARPTRSCEDPTYLIPAVPVSMAMMNLVYSLMFAGALGVALRRDHEGVS